MTWAHDIQAWATLGLQKVLAISGVIFVLFIVYQVAFALYNVYLHPLAKFPGPKIAAVSQIPYVRALVRGKLPHWVKGLHDRYGSDVVRISPTELSFINASAWNDIHTHRAGHQDFEKDLTVYGKPPNGVASLLTASHDDHSRMRRVLEHSFTSKAFKEQEPVVLSYVDNLISSLHEQVKGPTQGKVDVVKWFNWMSFDIIGDLAFGESFDCLKNERYHPWVEMIFGNLKGIALLSACNRFSALRRILPQLIPKSLIKMKDDHWAYTGEKIARRMELGTDRPDLMSPIIRFNGSEKGLTTEEIKSNMSLFIVAGSESVATNLSGATYHLLRNPRTMEKIVEEVCGNFEAESDINAQSVEQLPYLLAVLAETNRIYPTALTGQACRVPAGGDTISGYWVPGDTGVSINQYAAYHSTLNFSDPEVFIPERWLDDSRFSSDQKDIFHPFSLGARNCIGKLLGNAETRVVLAKLIWNFTVELCDETNPTWDDQQVYLSWQKTPLVVKLTSRKTN